MHSRRDILHRIVWGGALMTMAPHTWAQKYPVKPIQFIVPFPAGGSADVLARLVSQYLSKTWQQAVVVENKPGAGTVIGTSLAAKAPPDGQTLLFVSNSFVINTKLHSNLPYDGLKAFDPVALMCYSPQVVLVNANSPYKSLTDLLNAARNAPGTVSLGTLGPATAQHIAAEQLQRVTGVKFIYVPFQGDNLVVNAVLGGHLDSMLVNYSSVASQLSAGKLRPLAVTTLQRLEFLKETPTVAELGYPGYEAVAWFGVVVPVGSPKSIINAIADGLDSAIKDPDISSRMAVLGLQPANVRTTQMQTHIAQQYEQYSRIIDEAGIKIE